MGDLIEDYPEDAREHSCLILGAGGKVRAIHAVCAPMPIYLAINFMTAWVCSQCGEPFFEEREVESIQTALSKLDEHMIRIAPAA